jgi:hypothetical protein
MLPLLLLLTTGCKAPPEAPAELSDLARYLYANWDNEDPDYMMVGLNGLDEFIGDVDLDTPVLDRSWELASLTADDVSSVPHPDRAVNTLGVGVAYESVWPIADHAMLQLEADQRITEPSADIYDRTFPDEKDPTCFLDQSCQPLATVNDVERNNAILKIRGLLYKNYRWVELNENRTAIISQSYLQDSWVGEAGKSTIWQSYSIDVWLPKGGKTWRFQTLWSESEVANVGDNLLMGVVKASTDDIYKAGDDAIESLFHAE